VDELAESILRGRMLQPILLRPRSRDGYILIAGRHRLEAVRQLHKRKLGPDHIRAEIVDNLDADTALLAEIDENLVRSELSPIERALHVARRKKLYETLHPETKAKVAGGKARQGTASDNLSFAESTAKATGKNRRSVERDAARGDLDGIGEAIGTSLDKGEELDHLIKLPAHRRDALIARAKGGEKVSAKVEAKKVARAGRERDLAASTAAAAVALGQEIPASVIVVDWALKFEVRSEKGMDRSPENHYPCGSVEQMIALKPPMADHVVVFAWTSSPQLNNAMTILREWDLEYKAYWGWDKEADGTGYWGLSRLELILIATKGYKVPAPAMGEQGPQLFRARRGKHSEKPDEVYDEIARLYPNLIKLEMFARKPRQGWRTWGNEARPIEAPESDPEIVTRVQPDD
jgi:N6-adenosine-specific RNA methylase IME4